MSSEILKKFSEELKAVRKKKKITLEQIFNKTRIDIKYLEGIESGNFSLMPDVYIRAFLKQYAEFIGLNPNEVLDNYKLAKEGKLYEDTVKEKLTEENEKESSELKYEKPEFVSEDLEKNTDEILQNKSHNPVYLIFAAIALMLFTYFIYDSFVKDKTQPEVKEKPFGVVLKSNQEKSDFEIVKNTNTNIDADKINTKKIEPILNQTKNKTANSNKIGNLKLTIIGNDKSWMRVIIDDKKNNEFIIDEGIKKQLFADKKFYVHIGNSAGVSLYLNGKELTFKKAEGRVRKFNITEDGIKLIKREPVQQYEYEY